VLGDGHVLARRNAASAACLRGRLGASVLPVWSRVAAWEASHEPLALQHDELDARHDVDVGQPKPPVPLAQVSRLRAQQRCRGWLSFYHEADAADRPPRP
jgi:hypothetical protein